MSNKHTNGAPKKKSTESAIDAKELEQTPLDCHRTIICQGTLADRQNSHLITYFNVIDIFNVTDETFGQNVGLQAHFDVAGVGKYEIRLAWLSDEDGATSYPAADSNDVLEVNGRAHFAAFQLRFPALPGLWALGLEWRHVPTAARALGEPEEAWKRARALALLAIGSLGPEAGLKERLEAAAAEKLKAAGAKPGAQAAAKA